MKFARFIHGAKPKLGVVEGHQLFPLSDGHSIETIAADWPAVQSKVASSVMAQGIDLDDVTLLAPIARPGKIFAVGLNYRDHIEESNMEVPERQVWFTKAVTSINGPFDNVLIPKVSNLVDYEAELVAVIGKSGKCISVEDAPNHVFGYCVGNDFTERAWQFRSPQWSLGKSFDTHAPIGPWITTADELVDPHTLTISCFVNGERRQHSNTEHLVFTVWDMISELSQAMTLEPGDLIFTGTPGGIGAAMDPMQFLKEGDLVKTEISGLGYIENTLTQEH
ncbi:MAG: fumarylacetoacetate hydrolase family protein [Pseudomonadota bacterium]|nr:fumarylacetoacetate hydrolase family protein [Pseudomonadota bacterium]